MKAKNGFSALFFGTFCVFFSVLNGFGQAKAIIKTHFEALNRHDLDALSKQYTDSSKLKSVGWEGAKIGASGMREVYSRYFATSPDMVYAITNIIWSKNSAVVEYTSTGTMAKPEKGEPDYMQGKQYTLKNCALFKFRGNKIVEEMTYFDQLSFLRQVGFFEHLK